MDGKANYALVGLFVILLGMAFATAVVWLSTSTDDKDYNTYQAYMYESVSGLSPRALVTYRGVEVGLVRRIALDKNNPERVELLLDIEEGTPVKEDTEALLATQGITGIAHIELMGGSKQSPILRARPGHEYPIIQTKPSLLVRLDTAVSSLLARLSQMASQIGNVAERVNTLLDDDKQQKIADTLNNVERISRSFSKRTADIEESLAAFARITNASASAAQKLPVLVEQANGNLRQLETAIASIGHTTNRLDKYLTDSEGSLYQFVNSGLPQVTPLLTELRQLSSELGKMTRDLRRHPDALIFGPPVARPGPGE
jgi:phospholipid/cholesterol/gamma-HCH transport system substrate-binding protein